MKYTKEELDQIYNDPWIRDFSNMIGLNLREVIEAKKKDIDDEIEQSKKFHDSIDNILNDMVKEGSIKCREEKKNGATIRYYYPAEVEKKESNKTQDKKEYVAPETTERTFLMSEEQLEKFINNYTAIVEAINKISYLYGIKFNDSDSGFSFPGKLNEIIWDFVRIIFGDENAEDIADYIFGNSNFDSVKALYNELV